MASAASPARYALLCAGLGLALGWLPALLHGPVPGKFDVLYIRGDVAIWAFYGSRLAIGAAVGLSWWPGRWFLRGPAAGFACMLPPGLLLLATPGCGFP